MIALHYLRRCITYYQMCACRSRMGSASPFILWQPNTKNLPGGAENLRIYFLDKSPEGKADVLLTTRSAPRAWIHIIHRT